MVQKFRFRTLRDWVIEQFGNREIENLHHEVAQLLHYQITQLLNPTYAFPSVTISEKSAIVENSFSSARISANRFARTC